MCQPAVIDAPMCYVLYSEDSKLAANKRQSKNITFDAGTFGSSVLDKMLDPYTGNNSTGYKPCGIVCLHVDDLFMVGDGEFERIVNAHHVQVSDRIRRSQ